MLVVFSDVHLTDGTTNASIKENAFQRFAAYLEDLVFRADKVDRLTICLNGDFLDVIRSTRWLDTTIRPWSPEDEKDGDGMDLKAHTLAILEDIIKNPVNTASLEDFRGLLRTLEGKGVATEVVYIIGNHDWLINRYPEARRMTADFLGIPGWDENLPFPTELVAEREGVYATHGDIFDPVNFFEHRDRASLGDAVVIEIFNRFSREVGRIVGSDHPRLLNRLKEIDSVRPYTSMPAWVQRSCMMSDVPEVTRKVKKAWNGMVDGFFCLPFLYRYTWGWLKKDVMTALTGIVGYLLFLLVSTHVTWLDLARWLRLPVFKLFASDDNYLGDAWKKLKEINNNGSSRNAGSGVSRNGHGERQEVPGKVDFITFGHTHNPETAPMAHYPGRQEQIYVNTGCWRPSHFPTRFLLQQFQFATWDIMRFAVFYAPGERPAHKSAYSPEAQRQVAYHFDKRFEVIDIALG